MEHARQLAHAATLQVYQAMFDVAMLDDEPARLTRMLLSFTPSPSNALVPYVKPMEIDAMARELCIKADLHLGRRPRGDCQGHGRTLSPRGLHHRANTQ